uniref:Ephrin RBD domain-containing protein n=1 Tax=Timema cristinae TaxID=61476 RepID=A0A7R9D5T0_TIMCR|nr:unnamed protein product [Timema cristinae]
MAHSTIQEAHILTILREDRKEQLLECSLIGPLLNTLSSAVIFVIYDMVKYVLVIIMFVSKEEYDTCRITNPNPRIIAICDKPYKLMYFTITFRSFTPQPGGLEFQPGQDYYFISTSSKDDLHRRIGGRCSSHNMKVVFKVCCRPDLNLSECYSCLVVK